jgi:hypothetical protein
MDPNRPTRGVWRHWASSQTHDMQTPLNAWRGWLGVMRHELESGDGQHVQRALQQLERASTGVSRFLDALWAVARSDTVDGILGALADLFGPVVKVVVTGDGRNITIPNEDTGLVLWMLVQSQLMSTAGTIAVIRVDAGEQDVCRIVVGPDEQERGPDWKDVTGKACEDGWLSAAAHAFRAEGQEIRVRSNGPLAEVTLRWDRSR